MTTYKSTKPISEYKNDYPIGSIFYEYTGCTYGCISRDGVAVTLIPDATPFFEVPKDSVKEIPSVKE
jgi:hypothetical protein